MLSHGKLFSMVINGSQGRTWKQSGQLLLGLYGTFPSVYKESKIKGGLVDEEVKGHVIHTTTRFYTSSKAHVATSTAQTTSPRRTCADDERHVCKKVDE